MNPYRLNPRRLRLLKRVLKGLRPDVASLRFLYNHIRWALLNKEKSTKVPPPVNLILELSARCNLHCIMCARESRYGKEMDQGFMPPDKAKAVIDQALPYLTSIGLTGLGETFLYPHLEEICRYIKTRKPNVVITCSTNAHFHGFLEKLDKAIPYIDNLQISVDGVGKVYETIRPATDFSFIKQNILRTAEACRKYDVELKFNLVAMPQNIDNLKDVIDFTKEAGARSLEINPMNVAGNTSVGREFYKFFLSDKYKRTCREITEYAVNEGVELSLLPFQQRPDFHDCPFPWDHPYITWNGYLVPCCGKPFPKLLNFGNVFETGNLMAVINSPAAQKFRRGWQQGKAPSFCANCQYVTF